MSSTERELLQLPPLTHQELDHVLAGLRCCQALFTPANEQARPLEAIFDKLCHAKRIATERSSLLSDTEIDILCEKLNFDCVACQNPPPAT